MIADANEALNGLVPVKFSGDSRKFMNATKDGEIWPTREQLYAARALLPIEYPPAVTVDGRSVEQIEYEAIERYKREMAAQDLGEALIAAISKLRDAKTAPKGPVELIPPVQNTPRPEPRPKTGPVSDAAEIPSAADAAKLTASEANPDPTHPATHNAAADDGDMMDVAIPTRGKWLIKRVPRITLN